MSKISKLLETFQSTCPRGARPYAGMFIVRSPLFQSTCPRGARRRAAACHAALPYFNPRAHEGHDDVPLHVMQLTLISIHVPTRGTTEPWTSKPRTMIISIHVPTRGTTITVSDILDYGAFQSTCPRGARRFSSALWRSASISIHVPTRGTTWIPEGWWDP